MITAGVLTTPSSKDCIYFNAYVIAGGVSEMREIFTHM